MWDALWTDLDAATMAPDIDAAYGAIPDAAIGIADGRIAWIGPRAELPGAPESLAHETVSLGGAWVTPALVDCHTHLVFGGDRIGEFEKRLEGASYEEIARAGGGIKSTVAATRAASLDELVEAAIPRLEALKRGGVATVEIKSGYGLDVDTEIRMLEAAGRAAEAVGLRLRRTYLGLHALPEEYADRREAYVELICEKGLPQARAAGLVDAVDAFCETIGFTIEEVRRVFETARQLALPVRLHAEQLSDQGGAAMAAAFNALSADHLEYLDAAGVEAMAEAGTVAVLLPGAFYALGETRLPPVAALRERGVKMAVATDLNPGTSPLVSPTLAMNMACTLFGLTPEEALAGMTRNGAAALGLEDGIGTIETGKAADLAVWRISQPAEIAYWIGAAGPERLAIAGRLERMHA
ncbi:imidazolonepropionase [Marinicauda salina]|uniref:Imidazolonepropionase n=1 Tax=Marinicauda salina TaxID=2135793 RepID=A0A2U2BWX1_9PROT|nr:imidazolonepropionase [Marinicauda salina]PWE18502.1 imidazolonepropionase [Marinicauda salina]